jgi:uncharacterized protein (TIGR02145 family)
MKKSTLILLFILAIIKLQAQDYKISFAGTGASASVVTVKVENLTQGKSLTLNGTDVLRLMGTPTGISPVIDNSENTLRIYPNPTSGNSAIEFAVNAPGITTIELFDITGKKIGSMQNSLDVGAHSFKVSGLSSGIYNVKISSPAFSYSSKLVSNSTNNSGLKITYIGKHGNIDTPNKLKSAKTEKVMQYFAGDRLKYTGTSGILNTVQTDIPTQNHTITFTFIPCTDADGNNYSIVQIGSQIWMAENLKTTKYRNGDPIPNVTDNVARGGLTTGAYCNWGNDLSNANTYGRLYNWYAVSDNRNLAPTSWHVPTDSEWTTLTDFLGGAEVAGGKLKETGASHWHSPNTGATNETGFSAVPGGSSIFSGTFVSIGSEGARWSSTEGTTSGALDRTMDDNHSSMVRSGDSKRCGFSIRCLKD